MTGKDDNNENDDSPTNSTELEATKSLWLPTTTNRKTGNIPTSYIGQTKEHALSSCRAAGCDLLESNKCYAWYGTPRMAYASVTRAYNAGKSYDRAEAFLNAVRSARYVRVGALGDPHVLGREELEQTYEAALRAKFEGVLGYTHGWRDGQLQGLVLASCDNLRQADQAVDAGWRASAILPWNTPYKGIRTPSGRKVLVCPGQKKNVVCNDCGLCDARARGPPVIGFLDHSPQARAQQQKWR